MRGAQEIPVAVPASAQDTSRARRRLRRRPDHVPTVRKAGRSVEIRVALSRFPGLGSWADCNGSIHAIAPNPKDDQFIAYFTTSRYNGRIRRNVSLDV